MLRKLFVYVCFAALVVLLSAGAQADTFWNVPGDFDTIQDAINAASPGDTIIVGAGLWDGAVINKESLAIIGIGGAQIIGVDLLSNSTALVGFLLAFDEVEREGYANNTTISNFSFEDMDYPVYSSYNNVITVSHLKIKRCQVGISNVAGSNWTITHNEIEDLIYSNPDFGLPIGINLCGYESIAASNNLVAFNDISSLDPTGCTGAFACIGIFLGAGVLPTLPPGPVMNNKIVHNNVQINGGNYSAGLCFWGAITYINSNRVGFNDFRGTYVSTEPPMGFEMFLYQQGASPEANDFSRNFGDLWMFVPSPAFENIDTGENRAYDGFPADLFNPQPPEE